MRKVGLLVYAVNILISVNSLMQLWGTSRHVFSDSFLLGLRFLCKEQIEWEIVYFPDTSQSTPQ